jgi:hypothetical protein
MKFSEAIELVISNMWLTRDGSWMLLTTLLPLVLRTHMEVKHAAYRSLRNNVGARGAAVFGLF